MDSKHCWCLFIVFLSAFRNALGIYDNFVNCGWGNLKFNCTVLGQDENHTEFLNNNKFYSHTHERCFTQYNTNIKHLYFSNCQIPTVPRDFFQRYHDINTIVLSRSGILRFDEARFSDANKLKILSVDRNNLVELPDSLFSNTPQLENIDFSYNQIRKIVSKTFKGTTELQKINFGHNLIESIDGDAFDPLTMLIEIDFSYNRLETFPSKILKSEQLSKLYLNNNRIAQLDCDIFFDSRPIAAHHRTIDVSMNQLREIDLNCDKCITPLTLDISDNLLENLTLPAVSSLDCLNASRNNIESILVEGELKSLIALELANNSLKNVSNIFKYCTSLEKLDLSINDIEDVSSFSVPETLKYFELAKNGISKLGCNIFPTAKTYSTKLNVSMNLLTDIDLNCDNINGKLFLALDDNFLENLTLPVSTLMNNVEILYASGNRIKNIFIENELKNLMELRLVNNNLSSMSDLSDVFKHCSSLQILDLSFNDIRKFGANSLKNMEQLEELRLSHINLSQIDYGTFAYSKKLTILDLSHNNLKHFYFEWLLPTHKYLEKLHLNDNNITRFFDSPKDVAPKLNELFISNNNLDCGHLSKFIKEISLTKIKLLSEPAITTYDDVRPHVSGIPCFNRNNEHHECSC